jgi:hypothetical protein
MLKALVGIILNWIFGKIVEVYQKYKAQKGADSAIDQKVTKQKEKLKRSKTDQEDIDAAREILSRK